VVDPKTFEYLLPFAYEWAKGLEEFVLSCGALWVRDTAPTLNWPE
jgi:hypothetical protein